MNLQRNTICSAFLLLLFCTGLPLSAKLSSLPRKLSGQERYIQLRHMARFYGLELYDDRSDDWHLKSEWTHMQFSPNTRKAWLNGMAIWLQHAPRSFGRYWALHEKDVESLLDPVLRQNDALTGCGHRIVVLDPGHGGHDPGAIGSRRVEEKRVVLDVAKRARRYLANAGVRTYLTRDMDRFISLSERNFKAAKWNADVFVSIHINASATKSASGVETFVMTSPRCASTNARKQGPNGVGSSKGNRFDGPNAVLGYYLQKNLLRDTRRPDRGLRRARFQVLKDATCPAALVELGFVSNEEEQRLFLQSSYRQKLAEALAKGILEYMQAVRRSAISAIDE